MDFDDIGFFGLPILGATAAAAVATSSQNRRKRKKTDNNDVARERRRRQNPRASLARDDDDDDNGGGGERRRERGDRKGGSASSARPPSAAVTPGPPRPSEPSSLLSHGRIKFKSDKTKTRQLGLKSFMLAKTVKNSRGDPDGHSSRVTSAAAAERGRNDASAASSVSASGDGIGSSKGKKRPQSFTTAAEFLNEEIERRSGGRSDRGTQRPLDERQGEPPPKRNGGRAASGDEPEGPEEFSDDDEGGNDDGEENDEDDAAIARGQISADVVAIEERAGNEGIESAADESGEEERLLKIRLRLNPTVFGMRRWSFGRDLPATTGGGDDDGDGDADASPEARGTPLPGRGGSRAVLPRLLLRSIRPSARYSPHVVADLTGFVHSDGRWNVCDTAELGAAGGPGGGATTSMAFDRDGVLLACGDDGGRVTIYDFDDVRALDAAGRNRRGGASSGGDANDDANDVVACGNGGDERPELRGEPRRELPRVEPAIACPVLSFRCKGGNACLRISGILWSPMNQDHLVVSFANQQTVHVYDVASPQTPCLRLGDSRRPSRAEGVLTATFAPPPSSSAAQPSPARLLTGGSHGTVRLWRIASKPRSSRERPRGDDLDSKCLWSIPVFSKGGEGACDMTVLPSATPASRGDDDGTVEPTAAASSSTGDERPLVLVAGDASSLALLDTSRRTRKAFSTAATPTVAASWDLHRLAARELSRIDPARESRLPARRWTAVRRFHPLEYGEGRARDGGACSFFKVGMVAKCGWVFVAELSVPSAAAGGPNRANRTTARSDPVGLRLRIVRRTPRVQCFNSSNERLAALGGMALQFSLPDVPVPSASLRNMVWLGDVKARRYTMPHKDKYVLCANGAGATSASKATSSPSGEGLVLADFDEILDATSEDGADDAPEGSENSRVRARLPLSRRRGSPQSLAIHPGGEWMVVGYGTNGRCESSKPLELVSMRKSSPRF